VAKPKAARGRGQPTDYTPELAAEMCAMIAEGMSFKAVYSLPHMPARSTVYGWLSVHKEFSEMYARAQEERAEVLADQMLDIADNSDLDPNDRKVRLDTRKWIASKLKPGKYGDKVQVGGDASSPVIHTVRVTLVEPGSS
jgi:hypothetical protein